MKIILKAIILLATANLLAISNLSAKDFNPKKPAFISKAFILACEKKSIENPYSDFEAVIDKEGNPRCRGGRKYAKPHCPEGYNVVKNRCIKSALR